MLLDDIKQLVSTLASGPTYVLGGFQDTPDRQISLDEYGSLEPSMVHNSRLPSVENPRVHFEIRGAPGDYTTPRNDAHNAWKACFQANIAVNTVSYVRILPLQSPYHIGRDANNRHLFVFNVQVEKSPHD